MRPSRSNPDSFGDHRSYTFQRGGNTVTEYVVDDWYGNGKSFGIMWVRGTDPSVRELDGRPNPFCHVVMSNDVKEKYPDWYWAAYRRLGDSYDGYWVEGETTIETAQPVSSH